MDVQDLLPSVKVGEIKLHGIRKLDATTPQGLLDCVGVVITLQEQLGLMDAIVDQRDGTAIFNRHLAYDTQFAERLNGFLIPSATCGPGITLPDVTVHLLTACGFAHPSSIAGFNAGRTRSTRILRINEPATV